MSAATFGAGVLVGAASAPRLCLDCSQSIPATRLKAKPNAVRCVGCQEAYDTLAAEAPTDLRRLAFVGVPNSDDGSFVAGRARRRLSTGGIVSLMGSAEEAPGSATNTRHRVISPEGRAAMSELNRK